MMRLICNNSKHSRLLCLFTLAISLSSLSAMAVSKIKNHDQTMSIKTDAQGCVTQVVLKSPVDNCQGSEFENRCGRHGKDCVCILKSKSLSWEIDNNARFELKFVTTNPLNSNCKLKSGKDKIIKCKIESADGDFEYNVLAESCPGNSYDPVIIVRD